MNTTNEQLEKLRQENDDLREIIRHLEVHAHPSIDNPKFYATREAAYKLIAKHDVECSRRFV